MDGLGGVAYGLIMQELERGDSGLRSFDDERAELAGDGADQRVRQRGDEAEVPAQAGHRRVDRLLRPDRAEPRLRPGQHGHARAQGRRRLRAERLKMWITNSPVADVFVVWAKDDEGAIRGFVLEKGWKGLSAPAIHGKVGLRASITGEIVMDEVFCPEENAFPDVRGLKGPFTCLNSARYGIAWGALGAAEDCWHTARQYARSQAVRQAARRPTSWCRRSWPTCRPRSRKGLQGCLRLGRHEGRGHGRGRDHVSIMKRNSCGKSLDIARVARDMLGGNGISDEFGIARHLVNLEVVNTYEGTHDIHALILGEAITGVPAFNAPQAAPPKPPRQAGAARPPQTSAATAAAGAAAADATVAAPAGRR
jgi:glutaryl-CoA dehydrogenase